VFSAPTEFDVEYGAAEISGKSVRALNDDHQNEGANQMSFQYWGGSQPDCRCRKMLLRRWCGGLIGDDPE
jgi:hypothetical protein